MSSGRRLEQRKKSQQSRVGAAEDGDESERVKRRDIRNVRRAIARRTLTAHEPTKRTTMEAAPAAEGADAGRKRGTSRFKITPPAEAEVESRRAVLPSLPWVVRFLSFFFVLPYLTS